MMKIKKLLIEELEDCLAIRLNKNINNILIIFLKIEVEIHMTSIMIVTDGEVSLSYLVVASESENKTY